MDTQRRKKNLFGTEKDRPVIVSMGRSIFDPVWAEREHVNPHSELVHIISGEVQLQLPEMRISGGKNDTLYTPAGLPHRDIFPVDSVYEVFLISFDFPGEGKLLKEINLESITKISQATKQRIAESFRNIFSDFQRSGNFGCELATLELMQIIYRLYGELLPQKKGNIDNSDYKNASRREQIMARARDVLHDQLHLPLSLSEIADQVGVSPYYLSHIFSAESGFTLSSYLTNIRMERAAQLLADKSLSIGEIALKVGFADSHYFSRVFKAHFGLSPSAHRRR